MCYTMRCYWLYSVLEESPDPAHRRTSYCAYGGANPTTWNVHLVLGRGGAPLSVLSASVSAVLWRMNRDTALTECSSASGDGNNRFLSGELGGGRLGPGSEA